MKKEKIIDCLPATRLEENLMSAFLSLFILGVLGDVMALGSQLEIVNDNIFTDEQNTLVDHFSMIAELHGYDRCICTCGAPLGTHCKWLDNR